MSTENVLAPEAGNAWVTPLTGDGGTPPAPPPMPEAQAPAMPEPAPAPPPAMPEAQAPVPAPAVPEPAPAAPTAAPAAATTMVTEDSAKKDSAKKDGGWEVDTDRLRAFGDAVVRARAYLDAVRMKVDRMQGEEFTPQLGTSPVGVQLAKKFDDRLNAELGLRAMLAEAMTRMEKFVTSAEEAAKAYDEADEEAADTRPGHRGPG